MKKSRKYITKLTALLLSVLLFAAMPVYAAEDYTVTDHTEESADSEQIVSIPDEAEAELDVPEEAEQEEAVPEEAGQEEINPEEPETEQPVPEEETVEKAPLMAEEYVTITAYNRQEYDWGDAVLEAGYQYPTDASRELRIRGSGTSSNNITIQSVEWLKKDESTGEFVADTSSDHTFSIGRWKCILTLCGVSGANINDNSTGRGRIRFAGFPETTVWQGNGNSNGNIPYETEFDVTGTEFIEEITLQGCSPDELFVGDRLSVPEFTLDRDLISKGISIADVYWLKAPDEPWEFEWYEYPEVSPEHTVELGEYYLAVELTGSNASYQFSDELYVNDTGVGVYLSTHRESDNGILVANKYVVVADKDGIVYQLSEDDYDAVAAVDCFAYELDSDLVIPGEVTFGGKTYTVTVIDGAFPDTEIRSVTIPASVASIDDFSFDNCEMLERVEFEAGSRCKRIKNCVFRDCTALTNITLPKSLLRIGGGAFYNCSSLEKIRIPALARTIGLNAFERCSALSKVIFSEGSEVNTIGEHAFGNNTGNHPLLIRYYDDDAAAKETIEAYVSQVRSEGWTYVSAKPYPSKYISIKDCTIADIKDCVYTGAPRKPAVKITYKGKTLTAGVDYKLKYTNNLNVGKAKVTIEGIGSYKDKTSRTFRVNPKGTTIKSLEAYSKAIKVRWNVQSMKMSTSRITGYQIQLATDSAFTKNKKKITAEGYKRASQKVTGLKGGQKYYVRIRTYKVVDGKTYYSSWSKAKTVTAKK